MAHGSRPFFRADQVGSLLRPASLIAARQAHAAGQLDAGGLRRAEDEAIAQVVREQEAIGLPVVVDGEFRRENWWIDFIGRLDGVRITEGDSGQAFVGTTAPAAAACCDHGAAAQDDAQWRYVPKNVFTQGRLELGEPVNARDFGYLQSVANRPAKVTLPSPTRMHFHGGRAAVSAHAYPDLEAFFEDIVRIYRREIAALEEAGCRYIQIDDPLLTYFISDRLRQEVRDAGDDPDLRLARYVRLTNDCIAARRPDTAVGVHLCRGNSRSGWISEGGYARIAEAVFGGLQADHLLLEYDDERSGDFDPLRHVPRGRRVVLGLVTTKSGQLEPRDALLRRIDQASRLVPLEDLAISPQCGFASTVEGNIITPADQWAKLRLCVEVAAEVWAGSLRCRPGRLGGAGSFHQGAAPYPRPMNFSDAIAFANAHEVAWPRDPAADPARWGVHHADPAPFNVLRGPVHTRGGVSGLIRVGGREVAAWGDPERADLTFSIAKTYLGLLAGVAHGRGLLNPDERIGARLPGIGLDGEHNGQVTWAHLFEQTSEWTGTCLGIPDQVEHNRTVAHDPKPPKGRKGEARELQTPGSYWEYNDVRINQLAVALLHLFRRPLKEVFLETVLRPLGGGDSFDWEGYDDAWITLDGRRLPSVPGGSHWGGGVSISSRDQARIGQLMLDGGVHEGQALLPAGWVERMRQPCAMAPFYGWLCWLNQGGAMFPAASRSSFFMVGAGGHYVWVDPDHQAVVVVRWIDGAHAAGFVERVASVLTPLTAQAASD